MRTNQKACAYHKSPFIYMGIIFYRIALDFNYWFILSPNYAYMGFTRDMNHKDLMVSYLLLIVIALPLTSNLRKKQLSNLVISVISLCSIIPFTSMIAFVEVPTGLIILQMVYFAMLYAYMLIVPNFKIRLNNVQFKNKIIGMVIIYLMCVVLFVWVMYAHCRVNFNLLDVYTFREEAKNYRLPSIIGYSFSVSRNVLPVLMIYMLYIKKRGRALIICIMISLTFFVDGSKSVVFTTIFAIIGFYFYDSKYNVLFPWIVSIVPIASLLEWIIIKTQWINGVMIRRFFYLPNLAHIYYYDFFNNHAYDFFNQSILRRLGAKSIYTDSIKQIIGLEYFGSFDASVNNGLFSDAYSNLGCIGVFILPALVVIALRVLDSVAYKLPQNIVIVPVLICTVSLISSSFFVVMVSHGFIAICILLMFLPVESEIDAFNNRRRTIYRG